MSDITEKDSNQDVKIAVLESTLENATRRMELIHKRIDRTDERITKLNEDVRERIRALEKWVWGAGAVITAAVTLIGFVTAADARTFEKEEMNVGILTEKIRQYEIEKKRTPIEDVLKQALKEWERWQE
mgnify:CR=1 FL=1